VVLPVRPSAWLSAAIAAATLVVAMPAPASAQGFFEQLFGRPQRSYETQFGNAYVDPNGPSGEPQQRPSEPANTGRVVSYCVRTCDGRYFPMQRHPNVNPAQLCSSFCPAAKTQVFTGSDINYATAANGAQYPGSENAFVYRKQIVPGCTCNGRDAFGLAPVDIAADPTVKQGDIVVTAEGPMSLKGNQWTRAAVNLKASVPLARAPAREPVEPVEPGDQGPAND
jgi:hypothetical protein